MSIGKSSSNQSSDAAKVWGGQAPYLQSLYGQGQNTLGQANQFNNQVAPMLQNLMNPTNFGQMIAQAGAPMLQGIQDNSIQAMNLGVAVKVSHKASLAMIWEWNLSTNYRTYTTWDLAQAALHP